MISSLRAWACHASRFHLSFIVIAGPTAAVLLWLSADTFFILCHTECGENLIALHQARNYALTGQVWGLLENFATSPDPAAHPFLYTHNVNLGSLLYVALETLGVRAIEVKQLVSLSLFLLGIFFAYKLVAAVSRSIPVAAVFLLFFTADYFHVSAWGLNPLRGLHWLGLFSLLYFLHRLMQERTSDLDIAARIGVFVSAMVCFGLGYDFAAIAIVTALVFYFAFTDSPPGPRQTLVHLACALGGFLLAFALRQLQVIAELGATFWWTDLSLSALIKLPLIHKLATLPALDQIDALYASFNVWRPPARPEESLALILWTLGMLVNGVAIPSYGLVALFLGGLAALAGTSLMLARRGCSRRRLVVTTALVGLLLILPIAVIVDWGGDTLNGMRRKTDTAYGAALFLLALAVPLALAVRGQLGARLTARADVCTELMLKLSAVCSLGAIGGLWVFAPVSLHFYLKHEFPLLGAPIALAKAAFVAMAIAWAVSASGKRPGPARRAVPLLVGILLLADQLAITADNVEAKPGAPTEWMRFVNDHPHATYAVQWFPSTAAAFSRNWVAGLPPAAAREQMMRARRGERPFTIADYSLFGERDSKDRAAEYSRPDYWLYLVTEEVTPFDGAGPRCHKTYLQRAARRMRAAPSAPQLDSDQPLRAPPGDHFEFFLYVAGLSADTGHWSLEVRTEGGFRTQSPFNCIYQHADIVLQTEELRRPGSHILRVAALDDTGRRLELGAMELKVEPGVKTHKYAHSPKTHRQPTIDEMKTLSRIYPVADVGPRHVIFDLRSTSLKARPTP